MPRPGSERRSTWPAVVLAVLLPVLYVASIGPTGRGHVNGVDYRLLTWVTVYEPIFWATDRSETVCSWMENYLRFCGAPEVAWLVRYRWHEFNQIEVVPD